MLRTFFLTFTTCPVGASGGEGLPALRFGTVGCALALRLAPEPDLRRLPLLRRGSRADARRSRRCQLESLGLGRSFANGVELGIEGREPVSSPQPPSTGSR